MLLRAFPFFLLALLVHRSTFAAEAPPNVLLIVSDDQAWYDFGFMGSKDVNTPHLDRLASQSAVFERGYVPTSVCNPSLATILTGRYPHEHATGCRLESPPAAPGVVTARFKNCPTLPALLQPKNYVSLQTGKWWEGDYRLAGFTHGMTTGIPIFGSVARGTEDQVGRRGLGRLDRGMFYMEGAEALRIGRETMQPIYSFIREREDKPFFVWYAPIMPHGPLNPPKRFFDKYFAGGHPEHVAKYYGMIEWFDETCGELLAFLDKEGLSENTIVAFAVDNGVIPQGPNNKQMDYGRSKLTPYEVGIRTPIVLRWPGHIKPQRSDALVHTIDLAPTLLAACGVEKHEDMQGVNLLDLCDGKPLERKAVFGSMFMNYFAKNPKTPDETMSVRWGVEDYWKLIVPRGENAKVELFDLKSDPFEKTDLAATNPDRVAHLRQVIDAWWKPEFAEEKK